MVVVFGGVFVVVALWSSLLAASRYEMRPASLVLVFVSSVCVCGRSGGRRAQDGLVLTVLGLKVSNSFECDLADTAAKMALFDIWVEGPFIISLG